MSAIADHETRLPIPLIEQIVQRILDACRHAPVVLRRDEHIGAVLGDLSGPRSRVCSNVARGWVGIVQSRWNGALVEHGEVPRFEVDGREGEVGGCGGGK